jgi:translation initiation factor 1 (eIF-1/SUI1)
MSKKNKHRIDTQAEHQPLTDSPFSELGGLLSDLPAAKAPEPVKAITPPSEKDDIQPRLTFTRTKKGGYPVFLEKRGKGKTITVLRNVEGDLKGVLSLFKQRCGTGGVIRDGAIELQGDHRGILTAYLESLSGIR